MDIDENASKKSNEVPGPVSEHEEPEETVEEVTKRRRKSPLRDEPEEQATPEEPTVDRRALLRELAAKRQGGRRLTQRDRCVVVRLWRVLMRRA